MFVGQFHVKFSLLFSSDIQMAPQFLVIYSAGGPSVTATISMSGLEGV